jgi:hypothetical protein
MLVDWKVPYARAGFDDFELAADQLEHSHAPIVDPAKLKDRLLVLARTDEESQTIALPTGRNGSAGELMAAAIATAETNAFARPAGRWGSATVLLLGMGLAAAVTRKRKLWVAPMVAGFGAAYLLACLAVFEAGRVALPLTPMVGLALFVGAFRMLGKDEGKVKF